MKPAVAAALACCAVVWAQDAGVFSGTWEGKHADTVFLVLKVDAGDKIKGTMGLGDLQTEDNGDLREAGAPHGEYPISNARATAAYCGSSGRVMRMTLCTSSCD